MNIKRCDDPFFYIHISMASAVGNTFQRFQNRIVENKTTVDSQVSLSGQWSFSTDSNDNMLIKHGSVVHTTISTSGNITTPSIKISNGPSIDGAIITGLTNSTSVSKHRSNIPAHKLVTTLTRVSTPFGYVTSMSRDGLYYAGSTGLDGSIVCGTVVIINSSTNAEVVLNPPSGTFDRTMFGSSIHLNDDGSRIYIGEPGVNSVHIYVRQTNGVWILESTIVGPEKNAMFGSAIDVAVDSVIVIGSKASNSNNGAIYIYKRYNNTWTLKTSVVGNVNIPNYQLGVNVAISSDASIVIASAVGSSDIYRTSGTVECHVALQTASVWVKSHDITSPHITGPSTLFGGAIEISDDCKYMFIGNAEMNSGVASGHVYIYINVNNRWLHLTTLDDGRNHNARFGWTIKERNGVLMIGSPGDDNKCTSLNTGRVMVYKRQHDNWVYSHPIISTVLSSFFGWSISISDTDMFTVSGPFFEDGCLFVYHPDGYAFSGTVLKTDTMLPITANMSNIGTIDAPYTNVYTRNVPTVTADIRKKKNIRDVEHDIDFVKRLRPVEFAWKDIDDGKHCGFIGQNVATIVGKNSGIVVCNESTCAIRPSEILASLVAAYKQLYIKVQLLESRS
jgi:hypothetical protein